MGRTLSVFVLVVLAAGMALLSLLPPAAPAARTTPPAARDPDAIQALGRHGLLPRVGSRANLVRLLSRWDSRSRGRGHALSPFAGRARPETVAVLEQAPAALGEAESPAEQPAAKAEQPAGATPDHSRTNVQVEGVDEADLVKTDGRHIYRVSRSRVAIVRAYPPEEMRLLDTLDLGPGFAPRELYVDGEHLAVIGEGPGRSGQPLPSGEPIPGAGVGQPIPKPILPGEPPPGPHWGQTKVAVYDVSDPAAPRKTRELEIEGSYLSSRRVGPYLYLLAQRPVDLRILEPGGRAPATETPAYRDSARGPEPRSPEYGEVGYFPGFTEPNYLVVASLDLERPDRPAEVNVYLGGGQTVYASPQNLYVALTRHPAPDPGQEEDVVFSPSPGLAETVIHRFALREGRAVYEAQGKVPGTVLNQFSLDEYEGHLRVATTRGEVWTSGEAAARNNVYVLDRDLSIVGRLEDIAPGERIYSARFLGPRAYLVTFKKVDPFFVLDLSDPRAPRVLGYLKIPGYSDYLHPYDENHVLGFGKDTVEAGEDVAFYQGLKVALFDVRDVSRPVERFRVVIGDRGTESELLRSHRALLFSREKGLLAFPVELHEADPASRARDPLAYAPLTFQGLYVFSLDLERGFVLRGRITHLREEDLRWLSGLGYPYPGPWSDPGERMVDRGLYIGDVLYVLSPGVITAHGLGDLEGRGRVELLATTGG